MDILSEENIAKLAEELDTYILDVMDNYELPILVTLSVILARLTVAAEEFALNEEFSLILDDAKDKLKQNEQNYIVH